MRFKKKSYLLLVCSLALSARAATWYVAPDGDDGVAGTSWGTALLTIGTGVSKASAPDTVLVSNGVYMLPGEVWVSKGITIRSVNGRDVTIVNGNNPATGSRCFTLNHVDAVLDGFTITNGMTSLYGGGVYVPHGTVRNCIIAGNKATNAVAGGFGGGLRLNDGLVSNCIVYGNSVPWLGGGVSIGGGLVHSCIITGNVTTKLNAGQGGGVHLTDGVLSNCVVSGNSVDWFGSGLYIYNGLVTDCVISDNTCGERGAGVYVGGGGTINNSAIMNNTASNWGAGVNFWQGNSGTISNCVVSGNVCEQNGGGVFIYGGCDSTVLNCVISNNTAACGGGVYVNSDQGTIKNSVISDNLAVSSQGGGVFSGNSAHPVFRDCLITGNQATNSHGGGLCVGPTVIENCTVVSNSCRMDNGYVGGGMRSSINGTVIVNSIIYHNRAGTASASNYTVYIAPACFTNCCLAPAVSGGSAACSTNNITDDPMFVDTQTGNFRLLRDSPCIDSGVNQDWMTNAADMNNWPRINEEAVDMGCYEYVEEGCVFRFF